MYYISVYLLVSLSKTSEMYSDACSRHVKILLFLQIFMEILLHVFLFLVNQAFGSYKLIDCTCVSTQVCQVIYIH